MRAGVEIVAVVVFEGSGFSVWADTGEIRRKTDPITKHE
jgi:hypothetical protein